MIKFYGEMDEDNESKHKEMDLFTEKLKKPNLSTDLEPLNDDVILDEISSDDCENEVDVNDVSNKEKNDHSDKSSESSDSEENSIDGNEFSETELCDDDDDDNESTFKGPIRSKNELSDEQIPVIPSDFSILDTDKVLEIGVVKSVLDFNVIIQGNMTGEKRILKEGSIMCFEDHVLIGALCEVFGPLQNPYYRVGISKDDKEKNDFFKNKIGEKVFCVVSGTHWLDTFQIKQSKGTDASNGFDEELPEDEQDFSDDEKEAEFKKQKKLTKRKKINDGNNILPKRVFNKPTIPNIQKMKPPIGMTNFNTSSSYKPRNARVSSESIKSPYQEVDSQISFEQNPTYPYQHLIQQSSQYPNIFQIPQAYQQHHNHSHIFNQYNTPPTQLQVPHQSPIHYQFPGHYPYQNYTQPLQTQPYIHPPQQTNPQQHMTQAYQLQQLLMQQNQYTAHTNQPQNQQNLSNSFSGHYQYEDMYKK